MSDQYWNSASLLRASLISAGIREDVAGLVTARTRDNTQVITVFVTAMLLVAGAGIGANLAIVALIILAPEVPIQAGSVAATLLPQLATLVAALLAFRLIAQVWEELRFLIFIRIALNQSTLGVGTLCRSALSKAEGLAPEAFVKKTVGWILQVGVLTVAGLLVAVAIVRGI